MKKTVKRISRILALILSLVMLCSMAACSKTPAATTPTTGSSDGNVNVTEASESTSDDRTRGGIVNLALDSNPGNFFTPYNAGTVNSYAWVALEPLAWQKIDGNFYPVLAESWEMDNENNTLTIKLKAGITFSNGDPFDAHDVVFTHSVRNEFGTQGVIGSPEKIEAIDDLTVKFTWAEFGLNYDQMVLPQYIYSKETYDEMGLDWMLNNIVGTGPYVLEEYIPDVGLSFVRNENYWGETTPAPDGFKWSVITDSTAHLAAFVNGELDAWHIVREENIINQLKMSGYTSVPSSSGMVGTTQIQIITNNPEDPFYSADVRAAVYNGVNWDEMALTVGGATSYHTDNVGSKEMHYYKESIEKSNYDLEGAKKALADAGYPDGFSTTIYGAPGDAPAMAYLQSELSKLNITADVVTVDPSLRGAEYVTGKAIDSGLVFGGYGFSPNNTMDRFNKFLSPTGTWAGATEFCDEMVALWEDVKEAKSREEQFELLYQYCDMYVNKYHYMFPAYNTAPIGFFQSWYHESELVNGGNGNDPFEIWIDIH